MNINNVVTLYIIISNIYLNKFYIGRNIFMKKISVVVPVFNCDYFLQDALDSIVNQTIFEDIEVIMVDDGSTDDSKHIIDKYALDFENFYAYHIENKGVTFARNYGIDLAKGEYIHFMDADDYLPCEAYEKLYNLASKYDHDIVMGNFLRFTARRTWSNVISEFVFGNIEGNMDNTSLMENKALTWDMFLWNKLFKRNFLNENNIRFPNQNLTFQDNLFSIQAYTYSETVGIVLDYVYFWRERGSSISHSIHKKWASDRFIILNMVHDFVTNNISDKELLYYKYLKWLDLDLPNIINKFKYYSEKDHEFLFNNINKIVKLVPIEFFSNLSSYNKVLFDMVRNNDWDDLMEFTSHNLKSCPDEELSISDEYKNNLDLQSDALSEKLIGKIFSVSLNNNNLKIKFNYSINYLSDDEPHDCNLVLVDSKDNEYPIDYQDDVLSIDVDSLNCDDYSIKVKYYSELINKESFLITNSREIFDLEDSWIEINYDEFRFMSLSKYDKGETKIIIDDVDFADDMIRFNGESNKKFKNVIFKDILSFKKYFIPVTFENNNLSFELSFNEFYKVPVKQWELSIEDDLCEFNLNRTYEYCYEKYWIKVKNYGNKIIIEFQLYDQFKKINKLITEKKELQIKRKELQIKNKDLKTKNEDLKTKNKDLQIKLRKQKDLVKLYESRKDVRVVNKVKKLF